ncbi:hypothetical protein M5W83_21915 [Paenibacillus thiaminolyticus]|uniref:Uncharacterized protein n=1 Tax=Paenibacillus thiaminolyticus TaxID=49283 RepID=A0ABT4G163_PANTH|nr:hypothetical protein [Paenibacillus thiaminolyticus]MCY9533805.1 hypothetical protein [Paenibacillus thiaminolyticus]MCY9604390.1 hypothetical protein [Paenibacillus thiaminolyticus]MCY9609814.1 hypothetical protein [Paenibacillus thiaminolyticus]MCY9613758.1 hypothetical protein [Paenibacillus thiaminolyticus]MCY9620660.1 hypothetical protein [Paenibacillus thiaminolyticus]
MAMRRAGDMLCVLYEEIGAAFQGGRSADEALKRAEARILAMQQGGG